MGKLQYKDLQKHWLETLMGKACIRDKMIIFKWIFEKQA